VLFVLSGAYLSGTFKRAAEKTKQEK